MGTSKGFTLLELITVTMILAILYVWSGPALSKLYSRYQASTSVNNFIKALRHARYFALKYEHKTLVCPEYMGKCTNNWSLPIIVFSDDNQNLARDTDEEIIYSYQAIESAGHWLSRRDVAFIRFTERGHAYASSNTFVFCPKSGMLEFARQVIVNFQGRIRSQNYLSSRGQAYASLGQLSCT